MDSEKDSKESMLLAHLDDGNQSKRRKTEFKPIVYLERNGLYQAISAQDTLQSNKVMRPVSEHSESIKGGIYI